MQKDYARRHLGSRPWRCRQRAGCRDLPKISGGLARRECAASKPPGKSGDALVQALLPGLKSKYGKWGFFSDYAAADIEQTAQEL